MKVYTIGRSTTNNIVINDPSEKISRYHAKLEVYDDGTMIMYDDSANGTFVNGSKYQKQSFRVKKGDFINFAGIAPLDWNSISGMSTVAAPKSPSFNKSVNVESELKWWHIGLPVMALLIGAISYIWFGQKSVYDSSEIYQKYDNSVGLILQGFYYKLVDTNNDVPIAFIGLNRKKLQEGKIEWDAAAPSDKSKLHPVLFRGTGFFVSDGENGNGSIITNKHVAYPASVWGNKAMAGSLDPYLEKMKKDIESIVKTSKLMDGDLSSLSPDALKWGEQSDFIGIAPNSNFIHLESGLSYEEMYNKYKQQTVQCSRISRSIDKDVDLALIRTTSRELPKDCDYIDLSEDLEDDKQNLNPGSSATMIGFPATSSGVFVELDDLNQLKAMVMDGKITRAPTKYEVQYDILSRQGASGSPVFNQEGKLIAINYKGDTQLNYGILSGYIADLMDENSANIIMN